MSIFDNNTPKECNDEIQYQYLDSGIEELVQNYYDNLIWTNSGRSELTVKDLHKISIATLQYIWKYLGKKIPSNYRRVIDDKCNMLNFVSK